MKAAGKVNLLKCNICCISLTRKDSYERHLKRRDEVAQQKKQVPVTMRKQVAAEEKTANKQTKIITPISCRICQKLFTNKKKLEIHKSESHWPAEKDDREVEIFLLRETNELDKELFAPK